MRRENKDTPITGSVAAWLAWSSASVSDVILKFGAGKTIGLAGPSAYKPPVADTLLITKTGINYAWRKFLTFNNKVQFLKAISKRRSWLYISDLKRGEPNLEIFSSHFNFFEMHLNNYSKLLLTWSIYVHFWSISSCFQSSNLNPFMVLAKIFQISFLVGEVKTAICTPVRGWDRWKSEDR